MNRAENERRTEAATILRQLALGIDPQSGRLLESGHVALRPANMQALLLAIESLGPNVGPAKSSERQQRAGASWGKEEDLELRELFEDGKPQREVASLHQRTRGGISSRLVHLGLVESRR